VFRSAKCRSRAKWRLPDPGHGRAAPVEVLVDLIGSNNGDCWRSWLIRCTCSPRHDSTAVPSGVEPVVYAEVLSGEKDPHSAVLDLGLCKVQACLASTMRLANRIASCRQVRTTESSLR
jgi:hypothetical protein